MDINYNFLLLLYNTLTLHETFPLLHFLLLKLKLKNYYLNVLLRLFLLQMISFYYLIFSLSPNVLLVSFVLYIDLSELNLFIRKLTFRMDSFGSIMSLISRGDFFISIDLTDAYHAIAVHPLFHRFLTFIFMGVYYQYTCLPQGLTSSPRIFNKNHENCTYLFEVFCHQDSCLAG